MNTVKEINTSLLKLLQNGLHDPFEVNFLAKFCLKIAKSYLTSKNVLSNNHTKQYSIEEIALDSVVGLFKRNNNDGEYVLIHSFKKFVKPINSDAEAEYFIHFIVWKSVDQQLTKVYKDIDPFFGKILSSIKYIVKANAYFKQHYFGVAVIVDKPEKIFNAKIIDKENFDNIPIRMFIGNKELLLMELLDYLRNETPFYPAIPINLLVKRLKLIRLNDFIQPDYKKIDEDFDEIDTVDKIIRKSIDKTFCKLDKTYADKFTIEECRLFKEVIKDFSEECRNGGITKSLLEMFCAKAPDVNSEIFYSKYHNALNYLIAHFKKSVSKSISTKNNKF